MKKNTKVNTLRQGDVLIVPVAEIPSGVVKTDKVTLALGEVTGHHHSILTGNATGYSATDPKGLAEYFESTQTMTLTHQEHDTVTIPPGKYRSIIQSEYSPEALKQVRD